MRKYSLKTVIVLVLLASALICIITGLIFNRLTGFGTSDFHQVQRYAELLRKIDRYYIGDYTAEDVTDMALSAAVYALGDRWSYYMTDDEYVQYINSSNNQFVGIGIITSQDEQERGAAVLRVYEGSPAEEAGLKAGDVIVAVDGESVAGFTTEQLREVILREPRQSVLLTVLSDGMESDVTVICDYVYVPPVSCELLDDGIGLIDIDNFDTGAYDGFKSAYEELLGEGASSFIIDVRNNPGGYVNELQKILDYMLGECETFVYVSRTGKETVLTSDIDMQDHPTVVLFNKDSYSAAEYFAAVLSEYEYAETVGTHTTGKGRTQITVDLMDEGALHISSNEYVTPKRVSLYDAGGIAPDYEVELDEPSEELLVYDMLPRDSDTQLQKAIEILK
ncbi:MAG: PDZ domain-containing protein [Oscillospiraceae bacterium]|nr:PDZ domain-containing protein [Oscillospiraceae bacterium]